MAADACVEQRVGIGNLITDDNRILKSFCQRRLAAITRSTYLRDAQADRYERAIEIVLADPNTDMLPTIITPQAMTEALLTAQAIF